MAYLLEHFLPLLLFVHLDPVLARHQLFQLLFEVLVLLPESLYIP